MPRANLSVLFRTSENQKKCITPLTVLSKCIDLTFYTPFRNKVCHKRIRQSICEVYIKVYTYVRHGALVVADRMKH